VAGHWEVGTCDLSWWAGGGVCGTATVIQWHDKDEVALSVVIVWRHDGMSVRHLHYMSRAMRPLVMASHQKTTAVAFQVVYVVGGLSPAPFFMTSQLLEFLCVVFFQRLAEL